MADTREVPVPEGATVPASLAEQVQPEESGVGLDAEHLAALLGDGTVPRFGLPEEGHDDAGAAILKHVKCETIGCERSGHPPLPVHEDTVQPITCGGCGAVMHCDHTPEAEDREEVAGTLVNPMIVSRRHCRTCGIVLDERVTEKAPLNLDELPASVLSALGVTFRDKD